MYSLTFAITQGVVATRLWLRQRVGSERGASAVEYGLLVGLIAIVIAGAVLALGNNLFGLFHNTSNCIGGAAAGNTANCPQNG